MIHFLPSLLQELVYQVCLETGDSGDDATNLFCNYPDLLGDRFAGIVSFPGPPTLVHYDL